MLVTISDKKLGYSSNDSTVDYFNPQVVSAQDYYPFGMLQPGREFNVRGYRYGFNGKENDNEVKGEGNQQDYGMRIYDTRIGRFLSVDPLSSGYPMLTPYQYVSNRPIDGIDRDGLEYLTYTIVISRQSGNVLLKKAEWFNPKQHNAHGKLGQGVQYNITVYDEKYKLNTRVNYSFVGRNANEYILFIGHVFTEYGNYMGATSLYKVTKDGEFDQKEYDYDLPAVDAVDNYAKGHDKGYDALHAIGANSLFGDWGTTPVDEAAANGWINFLDKYDVGDVDPFNGQTVTKSERNAAWRGKTLFEYVINSKKMGIAEFMEKNYGFSWKMGTGVARTEHYYKLFLEKYLKKDEKGSWIRIESMWKKVDGNYVPKTPKEIKSEQKSS